MIQASISPRSKTLRMVLALAGLVIALAACGTQLSPEVQEPDIETLAVRYTNTSQGNTISYHDGANDRIYSFLRGSDGHLHVNYWDGFVWRWAHQGTPAGTTMVGEPEVLTYRQGGVQRIYVFVKGANNHLYVNYWDGARWNWAHQGVPQGVTAIAPMKAITYRDSARRQRQYIFANSGGTLYVNYWDGFQWRWANQGRPPGNIYITETAGVATFKDRSTGMQEIYAFVRGSNGRIYLNHWDGARWNWRDLNAPTGVSLTGSFEIATTGRGRPFHAFMRASNGRLYDLVETSTGAWRWRNQRVPAAATQVSSVLGTTTYVDGGRRIYTFVQASDGSLRVRYLSGGQWRWANQGIR